MAWLPRFACPECRAANLAGPDGRDAPVCRGCGIGFAPPNGIYRFLSRARADAAEPFQKQYRRVRQREGYRSTSPDYYRMLPSVPPGDPHAVEWRIRGESLALLRRHVLSEAGRAPVHALDLGAGCGWLSHRLAAEGHLVVAVDRLDDREDGLGACRHYPIAFPAVQADFAALPFEPGQFDLVVFDGSLHYASDPAAALVEAARMMAPGGRLAVMDSPMFDDDRDGEAMVSDALRRLQLEHGIRQPLRAGLGYLTAAALERAAARLALRGRFFRSRGPIGWRLRRQAARVRLGRAPAAFGVWVAR